MGSHLEVMTQGVVAHFPKPGACDKCTQQKHTKIKTVRIFKQQNTFGLVYIASSKQEGGSEYSRQLCNYP